MARSRDVALAAGLLVVGAGGSPHAVANKISKRAGGGEFHSVGGFVRAIFSDAGTQESAFMVFTALVALMLLAAIMAIAVGALQAVRGDRGGVETIVGGAYGLIAVLVMFAVIL